MAENILVIDDDPRMHDFLTQFLSPEGFTVSTASSGEDGINQALIHRPDLILLDLRMPVRDGITVCKVLRANPKTQHIPIIVLTGVLWPSHLREAMDSGADDVVSKPLDPSDLLIRIRAMLACRAIEGPVERLACYYDGIHDAASKSIPLHPPASEE